MHGFERNEAGKVFVGGLSWDTTKESLLSYFSQYGEVCDCVVMKNPDTGKSRGFGFVTYSDTNCVEIVLSVPSHIVDGRQVDPKACNPKGPQREGGRGGGQQGGDGQQRNQRGPRGHDPMKDRKIFIGGLPNNADEEAIKSFFSRYGPVVDVTVMYDAQKQRSRGFGFLTFETEDAVNQVCREHYIQFNGKKVECKRATPRDNRGGGHGGGEEPQLQMPPPMSLQQLEMATAAQQQNQHHNQGPVPGAEPNWAPQEPQWNQPPQQGPPPHMGGPGGHFQNVQFQGGFPQGEQPPTVQQASWPPQQPHQHTPGSWPPGGMPPPQQQGAPATAQFLAQPPAGSPPFSTQAGGLQPTGTPVYQWAASPPGQPQPPPANGQSAPGGIGAPPSSYSYAPPAYGAPAVAGLAPRPYQEFSNGQVQLATSVTPGQAPGVPASAPQATYSTYPSPYAAPVPQAVGQVPPTDPYGQPTPVAAPQGAVQVAAPPTPGQPGALPGYGSPLGQTPLTASPDASAPKVDYSQYYSTYGYGGEPSPAAAASAPYTAQPVPAPVPYAGQGEAPQAVAYGGGAPGPSPTFQRQGSAGQAYHPYARR